MWKLEQIMKRGKSLLSLLHHLQAIFCHLSLCIKVKLRGVFLNFSFLRFEHYILPNHWSNELTMKEYFVQIIVPYINKKHENLKLVKNYPVLLIFNNFTVQCTKNLLTFLDENNVHVVLIPANCTDKLQPLNLSVNKAAKDFLRSKFFQNWYA